MSDENNGLQVMQGQVKWFDATKGFGFIVADDSAADILLHANVLRNYGQSSVADGANITVKVQQTTRGIQAVEVVVIEPKLALVGEPVPWFGKPVEVWVLKLERGRVRLLGSDGP